MLIMVYDGLWSSYGLSPVPGEALVALVNL